MSAYEVVTAEGKVLRSFKATHIRLLEGGLFAYRTKKWGIMNSRAEPSQGRPSAG